MKGGFATKHRREPDQIKEINREPIGKMANTGVQPKGVL